MRITTLLLLTFAVGAGIGFGCSEANNAATADASVEQADSATDAGAVDAGQDAAVADSATSADAQLTDAAANDAGSDTDAGE